MGETCGCDAGEEEEGYGRDARLDQGVETGKNRFNEQDALCFKVLCADFVVSSEAMGEDGRNIPNKRSLCRFLLRRCSMVVLPFRSATAKANDFLTLFCCT